MYQLKRQIGQAVRFMGGPKDKVFVDPEKRRLYLDTGEVKLECAFKGEGNKMLFSVAPPKTKIFAEPFDVIQDCGRLKISTGRYRHFAHPENTIQTPQWDEDRPYGNVKLEHATWVSILTFADVWVKKKLAVTPLNRLFIRSTGKGVFFTAGDTHDVVISERIPSDCKPGTWYLPMNLFRHFVRIGWQNPVITFRKNSVTVGDSDIRIQMGGMVKNLSTEKLWREKPKYKFNITADDYKFFTRGPSYYQKCVTYEVRKNELWLCMRNFEINLGQISAPDLVLPVRGHFADRLQRSLSFLRPETRLQFYLDRSGIVVEIKRGKATFRFLTVAQEFCRR